jgi:hypothetical protein
MGRRKKTGPGDSGRQGLIGPFTRPGLAIPCRVAPQHCPTPFHQATASIRHRETRSERSRGRLTQNRPEEFHLNPALRQEPFGPTGKTPPESGPLRHSLLIPARDCQQRRSPRLSTPVARSGLSPQESIATGPRRPRAALRQWTGTDTLFTCRAPQVVVVYGLPWANRCFPDPRSSRSTGRTTASRARVREHALVTAVPDATMRIMARRHRCSCGVRCVSPFRREVTS